MEANKLHGFSPQSWGGFRFGFEWGPFITSSLAGANLYLVPMALG